MARARSKHTAADILALGEVQRLLRDEVRPVLLRLKATYCLEKASALSASLRRAVSFRARVRSCSNPRLVTLTEALFQEHLLPKLLVISAGTAGQFIDPLDGRRLPLTLAEYQKQHPDATHGLFVGKQLVKVGRKGTTQELLTDSRHKLFKEKHHET